jgi:hypothetical protein
VVLPLPKGEGGVRGKVLFDFPSRPLSFKSLSLLQIRAYPKRLSLRGQAAYSFSASLQWSFGFRETTIINISPRWALVGEGQRESGPPRD